MKLLIKFTSNLGDEISVIKEAQKKQEHLNGKFEKIESKLDKKFTNLRFDYETKIEKLEQKLREVKDTSSNGGNEKSVCSGNDSNVDDMKVERDYWRNKFL